MRRLQWKRQPSACKQFSEHATKDQGRTYVLRETSEGWTLSLPGRPKRSRTRCTLRAAKAWVRKLVIEARKTFVLELHLASVLQEAVADKMAHALGWPAPRALKSGRARRSLTKALNAAYRNHYASGTEGDPHWTAAQELGLAEGGESTTESAYFMWRVTPLGRRVLQLYLMALCLEQMHLVSVKAGNA